MTQQLAAALRLIAVNLGGVSTGIIISCVGGNRAIAQMFPPPQNAPAVTPAPQISPVAPPVNIAPAELTPPPTGSAQDLGTLTPTGEGLVETGASGRPTGGTDPRQEPLLTQPLIIPLNPALDGEIKPVKIRLQVPL